MGYVIQSISMRQLTADDCDACEAVEVAAFEHPEHRATRDKFEYRLTVCPELSLGAFGEHGEHGDQGEGGGKGYRLLGHIVATRCCDAVASDSSMKIPDKWQDLIPKSASAVAAAAAVAASKAASPDSPEQGHVADGTTVALHSLAIVPGAQGRGLGPQLMRAFLQRMATCGKGVMGEGQVPVERVALICQDYLVEFYKKLGFKSLGPSSAQFGGGGWFDMVYDF